MVDSNNEHRKLVPGAPEAPNNDARILVPIGLAAAVLLLLWGVWSQLGRHAAFDVAPIVRAAQAL
jgi:hypothetical protein